VPTPASRTSPTPSSVAASIPPPRLPTCSTTSARKKPPSRWPKPSRHSSRSASKRPADQTSGPVPGPEVRHFNRRLLLLQIDRRRVHAEARAVELPRPVVEDVAQVAMAAGAAHLGPHHPV